MQLPINCTASYHESFLTLAESKALYSQLVDVYNIPKSNLKLPHLGPEAVTDFGKLMFVDDELSNEVIFPQHAWGKVVTWSAEFHEIRKRVEEFCGRKFQTCVCIYYPNGTSGVDFHSDYSSFGDTTVIPSLSLGEEREFLLREKSSGDVFETVLQDGSMILMGEKCQERYEHSLPVNPKYQNPRINLTFRQYGFSN